MYNIREHRRNDVEKAAAAATAVVVVGVMEYVLSKVGLMQED